jgi:hypothetical protein
MMQIMVLLRESGMAATRRRAVRESPAARLHGRFFMAA